MSILAGTMAKTRELAELFSAIGSNDLVRANILARTVAGRHGARGHHRVERDLLGALDAPRSPQNGATAPTNAWQMNSSLMPLRPQKRLAELELTPSIRNTVNELLQEWRARARLSAKGIPRRWRLLFHGPSGCGKSVAAAAMAGEAGLPAFLVRFDSLIGAYLGQTALRLREVFRFAEQTPSLLLFDEVDALAKRRGSPMEVGELDRIVIAFMQELEHAHSDGFIVATSNLPQSLDDALWRRFDLRLQFPKPRKVDLVRFAQRHCKSFGLRPSRPLVIACRQAASYADAEQLVISEARRRMLAG